MYRYVAPFPELIINRLCKKEFFGISKRLLSEKTLNKLRSIVRDGGKISNSMSQREQHSHDESYHEHANPDVVIWPDNATQVSEIVKICSTERIPVIPFGTGSGLEGGICAVNGGVCINLSLMDKIIEYFPVDFHVTVQPGVTRTSINQFVKNDGLFFPVDPGADASLCGMTATGASGTTTVKYGTMKDNIVNLEVVLPSGKIFYTNGKSRRFRKSSAGYNLNELFIGSEGTLGIITAATLKLHGIPESTVASVCHFDTIKQAVDCSVNILQYNIGVARMELLDSVCMDAVNKFSSLSYSVAPTLFLEFHGSENVTRDQISVTEEIVKQNNGSKFEWASDIKTRNKLWKARHDAYYALKAMQPNCKTFVTDVCVPISNLTEAVLHAREVIDRVGLVGGNMGHVGDGNFHCDFYFDPDCKKSRQKAMYANEQITNKALELNGTCTGEHGIGIGKIKYLETERGETALQMMRDIKSIIDPANIMNPGKIFNS